MSGTRIERILIFLINAYRAAVRPMLIGQCRFDPTCSHYAEESIRKHGAGKGSWRALRRVLKCHPFNAGGFDPVT